MTYDLFISYKSEDRPWAERLYNDLRASYPWLKIFWDRTDIMAGANWRDVLKDAIINSKHLVVLWSARANSVEVQTEIADFEAELRRVPQLEDSKRQEIPIPLQGKVGGGLEEIQGFADLRTYYDPAVPDLGLASVNSGTGRAEWDRMIRGLEDMIFRSDEALPVIAAICVTNTAFLRAFDTYRSGPRFMEGPTLDDFLAGFSLQWDDVRKWYGGNALEWRPFGGAQTIWELLEDLRVTTNSRLKKSNRFKWDYVDLLTREGLAKLPELQNAPSVVILDPVSLYEHIAGNAFQKLKGYLSQEHSVVVSIAPVAQTGTDWMGDALRYWGEPMLNEYFEPPIPPASFARCALGVRRIKDLEPLIRIRIGSALLGEKRDEAKSVRGNPQR